MMSSQSTAAGRRLQWAARLSGIALLMLGLKEVAISMGNDMRESNSTGAPTASFWHPSPESLKTAQAKLTWLGEQSKPVPTVAFYMDRLSLECFQPHQGDAAYLNDDLPYTRAFKVTPAQFEACLKAIQPALENLPDQPRTPKAQRPRDRRDLSLAIV